MFSREACVTNRQHVKNYGKNIWFFSNVSIRGQSWKLCSATGDLKLWGYHKKITLTHSCYGNAIWKQNQKTSAGPLIVSLYTFLYPFPQSTFTYSDAPSSSFISHHFSLTVSSNPSHCRWCPWKGGPFLNLWLLWSPSISSSAMQSIIPLLYSLSHLLPSPLISCSPPHLLYFSPRQTLLLYPPPPHFSILSVVSSYSLIQ